jgi:septum formation topological specificity factor MinE
MTLAEYRRLIMSQRAQQSALSRRRRRLVIAQRRQSDIEPDCV